MRLEPLSAEATERDARRVVFEVLFEVTIVNFHVRMTWESI